MSSKVPLPPPEFDDLSVEEDEDDQALWEYMTAGPDKVPVPEWHLELLQEREARYGGAVVGKTWEEVEEELDKILLNKS